MAEYRLLSVQEFYIAIQDQIRQMHRCRHDLAKHIQMLELLQEKDHGFLQDYTEKLRAEYRRQKELSSRYCPHEVVNLILLLKEQQCQEQELAFSAAVSADSLESIGNLDWVGLLYNLLDNAIEASQRASSSRNQGISLCLEEKPGTLILTVENPVSPEEKLSFSTRKDNKELHGFGLEIVDDILKKYQGERTAALDKSTWTLCTCCTLRTEGAVHE